MDIGWGDGVDWIAIKPASRLETQHMLRWAAVLVSLVSPFLLGPWYSCHLNTMCCDSFANNPIPDFHHINIGVQNQAQILLYTYATLKIKRIHTIMYCICKQDHKILVQQNVPFNLLFSISDFKWIIFNINRSIQTQICHRNWYKLSHRPNLILVLIFYTLSSAIIMMRFT